MASETGRDATSPLEMPPRGWWQIAKRTYAEATRDHLDLIAAGVAFYGFLALVPLLAALVLTYGLLVDPADVAHHIQRLTGHLPTDAAKLVNEQLVAVVATATGKKGLGLFVALGLAVYGAMKGANAIVTALNVAYEQSETRGFIRATLVNAAITLGTLLLALALLVAASVSGFLEKLVGPLGDAAALAIKLGTWAATAALASGGIAALYRFGPARAHARWVWLSPGSLLATAGLALTTLGFGVYAASFGNYNATYGSLGAVVVLLMWLYLSAYTLLLGAEFNAELEHQTARDTTTGPEQPLGDRGATMADRVAAQG